MDKTLRELFAYYQGQETTCPETEAMLNEEYKNWTLDTIVDVKEYLDFHKKHKIEKFALVAIYKGMTKQEQKDLSKWGKDLIKDTVFNDQEDKDKHDKVKKNDDDEKSLRYARKLVLKDGKATDTEILDKCIEVLGLLP